MVRRGRLDQFCLRHPDAPSLALWRAFEAEQYDGLRPESPSLDLGCGDGSFATLAFPTGFDVGCDRRTGIARNGGAAVYGRIDNADARDLPYADKSFRTVVANCVLEHVDGVDAALSEIGRILRPGGRLYASVPTAYFNRWYWVSVICRTFGLRRLADRSIEWFNRLQEHHNVFPEEVWKAKLAVSGMSLESARFYLGPRDYTLFSILDTVWKLPFPWPGCGRTHGVAAVFHRVGNLAPGRALGRMWRAVFRCLLNRDRRRPAAGAGMFFVAVRN